MIAIQPRQDPEQGALAATAGPHYTGNAAFGKDEIYVHQRSHMLAMGTQVLLAHIQGLHAVACPLLRLR
jgi:hypothetical protein